MGQAPDHPRLGARHAVAWRAVVGPVVSVITVLAMLGFLATDMLLSMGD